MIPIELLITFFLASSLLCIAPGPDNIFVLTQAAVNGSIAGIFITFGLCTGLVFHTAIVALGIATIFQTSELAFNVLKIMGAFYLLYLAWQSFKASSNKIQLVDTSRISLSRLYRRGIIMNITNPKVSIFFLAFLPQFASQERGSLFLQFIFLGVVFIALALVIFCLIAILAGYLSSLLARSTKAHKILNKIAGTVFAGLAIKLALSER